VTAANKIKNAPGKAAGKEPGDTSTDASGKAGPGKKPSTTTGVAQPGLIKKTTKADDKGDEDDPIA
jgi:hypothetical protein